MLKVVSNKCLTALLYTGDNAAEVMGFIGEHLVTHAEKLKDEGLRLSTLGLSYEDIYPGCYIVKGEGTLQFFGNYKAMVDEYDIVGDEQ